MSLWALQKHFCLNLSWLPGADNSATRIVDCFSKEWMASSGTGVGFVLVTCEEHQPDASVIPRKYQSGHPRSPCAEKGHVCGTCVIQVL